ncbi:MAG: hypothetical protein QXY62_01300 [Candidatus Altiarchaeota archaeon]
MQVVICPKCKGNMIYPLNKGSIMEKAQKYKCITCSSIFSKIRKSLGI